MAKKRARKKVLQQLEPTQQVTVSVSLNNGYNEEVNGSVSRTFAVPQTDSVTLLHAVATYFQKLGRRRLVPPRVKARRRRRRAAAK